MSVNLCGLEGKTLVSFTGSPSSIPCIGKGYFIVCFPFLHDFYFNFLPMNKKCDAITTNSYGPRTMYKRVFSCTYLESENLKWIWTRVVGRCTYHEKEMEKTGVS